MDYYVDSGLWVPSTGRFGISGSRNWPETRWKLIYYAVCEVSQRIAEHGLTPVMVEGCCPTGVDNLAERMWRAWGHEPDHFPASWGACTSSCPPKPHRRVRKGSGKSYCPLAGFRRNEQMVRSELDILLAFPLGESPGTRDCMRRAVNAGVPMVPVSEPGNGVASPPLPRGNV